MTKEEFLKIVDSGNSKDYSNNVEFISIAKQVSEEYKQQRENQSKSKQLILDKIENTIIDLIDKNKDSIPNIKTLSINPKCNHNDVYEDMIDSNEPETASGNVLVCRYDIDNLELKVEGMYRNVDVVNFGNEIVFVTDGKTFNAVGDGDDTAGAETLKELLSYIDEDILESSLRIDKNLFNTDANYFILQ
jgi:hypothetical protein